MRAVAREQTPEGPGSEAAEELNQRMPEALKRRRSGGSERGSTCRRSAELGLPAVQRAYRCPPSRYDRDDPVRESSVAGMEERIEHVRQPRTEVAGQEAPERLESEMLRACCWALARA